MASQEPIQHVIHSLESLGLEVMFCEKSKEVPFDVALASIGFDEKNRSLVLQVQQYDQKISLQGEEEIPSQNDNLQMLQFLLTVPIEIPGETAPEVLRLIALANKSFPLGSFNYSEIEKSVYFSYGYPVFSTPPNDMTILLIVNTILFAKETFFPVIDDVASSRQTVDTIIGETVPTAREFVEEKL